MPTKCYSGIEVPQQIEEPCGGKYTSTDCIASPNANIILDLPSGASQTETNAALTTALVYKEQQVEDLRNSLLAIDGSETKIVAGNNITVIGTGTNLNPYIVNTENLQKIISYTTDFVDNNYTLSNLDNGYDIIIENFNEEELLTSLNIIVPLGLESKFKVRLLKINTGIVNVNGDATLNRPPTTSAEIGHKNDWVSVERLYDTDIYFLTGALGLPT